MRTLSIWPTKDLSLEMTSNLLFVTQLLHLVGGAALVHSGPGWTECSLSCGGGVQRRVNDSSVTRLCNTISCPGDAGCLSAYLSFEHAHMKSIYDDSHNGNLGTMHGNAKIVPHGKFGKALHLTKNGSVSFDVKRFRNRPVDAITIAMWLNLTDVVRPHDIFFTCGSPQMYNMGDYRFSIANGKVNWFLKSPSGIKVFDIESGATLKNKEWVHITGSHRTSTGRARLYINGKLAKEVNATKPAKRDEQILGQAADVPSWKCAKLGSQEKQTPARVFMDEFYVFKCELLKDEIQDLYSKNSVKRFGIPKPHYRPQHAMNARSRQTSPKPGA